VLDGETGLLVHPEDPADVAAAVTRLLIDADLRRALGERARERALTERSFETFRDAVRALVEDLGVVPEPRP
jgi:polysaccharide biosynthesis protein PelF